MAKLQEIPPDPSLYLQYTNEIIFSNYHALLSHNETTIS